MKRSLSMVAMLLASVLTTVAQSNLVIRSFDQPGQIVFDRVFTSAWYKVEWAPSAGASWATFTAAASALDHIPGAGGGPVTASVPMLYRVVAEFPPPGMVIIPAGSFVMGCATNVFPASEANFDELPQHTVYVSAFYMDIHEVTKALWDDVANWASTNGYDILANHGVGKATNHPVQSVTWFQCARWCNARSERDGLMPVYYTDAGFTAVHKTGEITPFPNWSANGFRLPTEAEWERAARGGVADTRFPWTDYTNNISWAKANYNAQSNYLNYSYDLDWGGGFHPAFNDSTPFTSPVGYFAPNGYGLYDIAGNVSEWCWDWHDDDYYTYSPRTDPRGPAGPLTFRVTRGGSYGAIAYQTRVSSRTVQFPYLPSESGGFRCARGL